VTDHPSDIVEKGPRERRNRDAEMMRAALELFARKGYAAASVQDVADAIGVLKGSVYHYIGSKEDLLFRIFHDAHVENEALMLKVAALDVEPLEKLRIYLERSLLTTLNNIERTTLYFRDWRHLTGERHKTLARHRAQYDLFLRQLIEAVYKAEGIEANIDLKHVSSFVIGGINWVADWFHPGGHDSAESIAADYTTLAMSAILGGSAMPRSRPNRKPRPTRRSRSRVT
jgi:AcrR family transcriptional regulator